MILNPELRRNIWLDFTFHRIIMTPIVILLFVYLLYLSSGPGGSANIAFKLACLFIFVWGIKRASETVIEEINNNTWDFQRQGATTAWEMTWGKLLGATAFSWYGAMICFFLYGFFQQQSSTFMGFGPRALSIFHEILLMLLGGLFAQAFALLLSIQALKQIRREKNNRSFRYFLMGILVGIIVTKSCLNAATLGQTISWHGYQINARTFTFTSLILFLGWSIVGLQRSFCKELQYQHIPWVWVLFNIFCMGYFSGFVSFEQLHLDNFNINYFKDIAIELQHAPLYVAFFVAQILTYFALFNDDLTFIRYKYFLTRIAEKNVFESLQQLPWWPISFICTLLSGILVACQQSATSPLMEHFSGTIFVLTTVLFLTRDIALIHFFNFGKNPRKASGTSALYLFLLYFLFPLLLNALQLSNLLPLLIPSWGQHTLLAVFSSLAQIIGISLLARKRWYRLHTGLSTKERSISNVQKT